MRRKFHGFADFYAFYQREHEHRVNRWLHFAGSCGVLLLLLMSLLTRSYAWLVLMPICGYGLAWIGHFFFERNRPTTFEHPLLSFVSDWVMFKDMLTGKTSF